MGMIVVELAPRLPISVKITGNTLSMVTILWNLTGGSYNLSRPETFSVLFGVNSTLLNLHSPEITASPSTQTYSTQLTSLEPGTRYFYRIQSRNMFDTIFTVVNQFTTSKFKKW